MKKETGDKVTKTYAAFSCMVIIIWMAISISKAHTRSISNMEYIGGGYAYDKTTNIIYSENGFMSTTYTELRDEHGCRFYYIPEIKKWIILR